jgi:diguanylate cyclase (GGDEF)-like protein
MSTSHSVPATQPDLLLRYKRRTYIAALLFAVLVVLLWKDELKQSEDGRYLILTSALVAASFLTISLIIIPRSIYLIELFVYPLVVITMGGLAQITIYQVLKTSSDPRLISDVTNGLSMWFLVFLGTAYFSLSQKPVKVLIMFMIVIMTGIAIGNFFLVPETEIKFIPYFFRWVNSIGSFIIVMLTFRWLGDYQQRQASTDALTGLLNRHALYQIIEREIARSKRSQKPFSIIIFDIDHFKEVNDIYGHNEGDFVLAELSKLICHATREVDSAGRWGGEEFILLLPETNRDTAQTLAERLRTLIENNSFGEKVDKVTASFGITEYKAGDNLENILKQADDALYQAKEGGRNKVVVF